LETIIRKQRVVEAYTQERDRLFIKIPLPGKPDFHIIISTSPQNPFVSAKDEHFKAKKNTVSFFNEYFPSPIGSIGIAEGDRVIRIELGCGALLIFFRGSKSNIFFISENEIRSSFKKITEAERKSLNNEIEGIKFISSIGEVEKITDAETDELKLRKLPYIGKEIIKESEYRGTDLIAQFKKVINEILTGNIIVYHDEETGKPSFHPVTFKSYKIPKDHFEFDNFIDALNKYFSQNYTRSNVKILKKQIDTHISKEMESLSHKLNNLKARVDAGTKDELYHHFGDLLLANRHLIQRGMKEISLEDYTAGTPVIIRLDEKLSPNQNVDRYFDKSRAEKIEYAKSVELLRTASKSFTRLAEIRERFENAAELNELLQIKKELKMTTQNPRQKDDAERLNFRHFLIDNKYHVFVGKDSRNNDQLTTKFAKQNDFWFHARSVSGSHVVLRVENTKEVIPKNILLKAASIAAFYSKAKTSKLVPVTYTLKKYVNKNARHEVGQVTVTKESVLLVKPEIPKDCEAVNE